jgi:hypothetical protein
MPIRKVAGGYKWGSHGHTYPTRAGAEAQAAAAYAHGYRGSERKGQRRKSNKGHSPERRTRKRDRRMYGMSNHKG